MPGSPFHKDDQAVPIADVNVVPLADVSLVLLIILLVLSPMSSQSLLKVQTTAAESDVALPAPVEMPSSRVPEMVTAVGVSAAGFVVDGKLLAGVSELTSYLRIKLASRMDRKVFVAPDLEVTHGQVIAALTSVQAAGGMAALVQIPDPEAR